MAPKAGGPVALGLVASQVSRRPPPGGTGFTLLLGLLTAFGPLSIDMYLPALPALADSLRTGATQAQFTLSAFFLGFGSGQLAYGPLSDRWGRKPPLLSGIALYICASMLCAQSTRITALIFLRLLQGLGACAGPLIARAVVRDVYERDRTASTLSLLTLIMGAAPLLGPFLGGQLLLRFGWRSIFEVLTGFGIVCFLGAWLALAETLDGARRSSAGVTAIIGRYGTLLRDRAYAGYTLSSAAAFAGMFAYFAGSPFVFIRMYGVRAQDYGYLFALNVVGLMVCAALNSRLVLRHGANRMLGLGVAAIAAAGAALLLAALTGFGGLLGLVVPLFVFIASLSFVGGNALAGALTRFHQVAGTASALAGTLQFGLGALAGVLVGALHNGTAVPMAGVIAACGLTSILAHRLLIRA